MPPAENRGARSSGGLGSSTDSRISLCLDVENGIVKDSGPGGHHGKLSGQAKIIEAALPSALVPWVRFVGKVIGARGAALTDVTIRAEVNGEEIARATSGHQGGYALGREYEEFEDGLLVAITERRTPAQIDALAEALEAAVAAERGEKLPDSGSKSPQHAEGAVA